MGASQSKIHEPVITEKLAERLRAMQLEHEKDYVLVGGESGANSYCECNFTTISDLALAKRSLSHNEDVSISTTEKWQEELLADPKVWTPYTIHAQNLVR
jgi:hypothetical protein